jgi:hypothetical protein
MKISAGWGRRNSGILPAMWFLAVGGSIVGLATPNPTLTALGMLVVPIFFTLLWRTQEPPVLLFAVGYQWLQVFLPVLNANLAGIDMAQDAAVPHLDYAAYLGFAALLMLAFGMRIGIGRRALDPRDDALKEVRGLTVGRLITAYAIAQAVALAVNVIGGAAPGLRQPLLALGLFRWTVVFVVLWAGFCDKRFRGLAVALLCFEIGLGLLSYFSAFKQVLFVAIIVGLAATKDPRRFVRPQVLVVALLLVALGVFWQAIKVDYREFLNQGSSSQTVRVPIDKRIEYLSHKVSTLTSDDLAKGFGSGMERTGYLEYFARATTVVPDQVPYQGGRLWGEALTHIVTPRLLFPGKAVINDSDRVIQFTHMWVAGAAEGTSVSLGYAAESYIDFGPLLMFVPVILLGVFWGWAYRVLATTGRHRLMALGFATSLILLNAILFESSNIKIVGGGVTALLVAWCVLRFGSDWIWSIMTRGRRRDRHARAA